MKSGIKVRFWTIQFPMDDALPHIIRLYLEHGGERKLVTVKAYTPVEAHFSLERSLMRSLGITRSQVERLLAPLSLIPDDEMAWQEQEEDVAWPGD